MHHHQQWRDLLKLQAMVGFLVSSYFMNQAGKFFFGNVIGFRGLQSFVVMNESLNMSFLFLTDRACYTIAKTKLDIVCKCFVNFFSFQANNFIWHPNLTKLFMDY
jgi:hypothetical protein